MNNDFWMVVCAVACAINFGQFAKSWHVFVGVLTFEGFLGGLIINAIK